MEKEAKKEHGPGEFNEEGTYVKDFDDFDANTQALIPPLEYRMPQDCKCDDRDDDDALLSETTLAQTSGDCPHCDCDEDGDDETEDEAEDET